MFFFTPLKLRSTLGALMLYAHVFLSTEHPLSVSPKAIDMGLDVEERESLSPKSS